MKRRSLIRQLGAAGTTACAVGLAGCSGGSGDGTPTPTGHGLSAEDVERTMEDGYNSKYIELREMEEEFTDNVDTFRVSGIAKNVKGEWPRTLIIEYTFYDKEGVRMTNGKEKMRGVEAGDSVRFEIEISDNVEELERYELVKNAP